MKIKSTIQANQGNEKTSKKKKKKKKFAKYFEQKKMFLILCKNSVPKQFIGNELNVTVI